MFALAFVLYLHPAAADGVADLEGGEGQFQLVVAVGSPFDLAESGRPIPMEVRVVDVRGVPQAGVPVKLAASAGTVSPDRVLTDASGRASFVFSASTAGETVVRIVATTDLSGAAQGISAFRVRVVRLPPPPIYARGELVSVGFLSGVLAFLWSSGPGRHVALGLAFPLYTRLKREQVLDHFLRGQVFGAIRTQPGVNFTAIRDTLSLSNGSLSYHLRILELAGFIRSEHEGFYKRFYPADAHTAGNGEGLVRSALQSRLLHLIRQRPGAPQRDLARETGVTQQAVSYNLRILQDQGLLEAQGGRRSRRYLVLDG